MNPLEFTLLIVITTCAIYFYLRLKACRRALVEEMDARIETKRNLNRTCDGFRVEKNDLENEIFRQKKQITAMSAEIAALTPPPPAPDRLPQISGLPRPEWLHADIREWKKFLESETGQKLYQQLIYAESGVFMEAVAGKSNRPDLSTDFLRGRAQGYRTLFKDLDTLATTAAHAANLDTEDPEQAPVT